jgi:HlyD family secretion protein
VAAGRASSADAVSAAAPEVAVPKSSSGWGRSGHWRAVIIGSLATLLIVGGGIAAWAEVSGGSTGYRMATVTRANIGTTLTVVGTVEPVNDAAASFQVGGQVATVTVSPGQQVTAGEILGTLNTTSLSESVSSAQSTLSADEAKLAEDEVNESSNTGTSSQNTSNHAGASSPSQNTTGTTTPSRSGFGSGFGGSGSSSGGSGSGGSGSSGSGSGGSGSGSQNSTITQDQAALTRDESTLSKQQQQEAADLTQAQNDCTSTNTATPTGQATCEAALQKVSADEQQVSTDETAVSKDESVLAQALAAAAGGGASGSSPTQGGHLEASDVADFSGNTGAGGTGSTGSGTQSPGGGDAGASTNTDTPEQIASDQAAIDTAQANLTETQQSLAETTLTSPIAGTVVSVGISVGDTVSAGSSTEIITIIGTKSYEVQATLDSSQIPEVKTGQSAQVEVDGVDGDLDGTVSQVGPVQSTSSGYSYPVVVSLPDPSDSLYAGSGSNVDISTGEVSNVVAVPTSAVQTLGARSYVLALSKGQLTERPIHVGMVGDAYTQVLSGLTPGQSVVLADYAEAVPSSNTNTTGGLRSILGGGSGGGFAGGGFFFNRGGGGAGGFSARTGGATGGG